MSTIFFPEDILTPLAFWDALHKQQLGLLIEPILPWERIFYGPLETETEKESTDVYDIFS